MNEPDPVFSQIERLSEREHELREREGQSGVSDAERDELRQIGLRLDQYWDLLRRRRARAEAGGDPDEERLRDLDTVESYQQ